MKAISLLALIALIPAAGCGDKSGKSGSSSTNASSSPLTAPVDYLDALGKAKQTAAKTADTASINQAIAAFSAEKGRNPKDLNELVQEKYLSRLPQPPYGMKFLYESNSGVFKVVPK